MPTSNPPPPPTQMQMQPQMQAIHIPSFLPNPSTLKPSQIPLPNRHAQDDYLIRITHCSPQHADILHAQGKHQNVHPKKGNVHPPFVLGYDFAGVVAEEPASLSTLEAAALSPAPRKGDRVFGASIGAFAEYIVVKARQVRRVPDGVSSAVACAVSGQAVSYAAVVHVAKVQAGETVLVSGASGGLGSACCAVARAVGARVVALVGDEGKARDVRRDMDVDFVVVVGDGKGNGDEGTGWMEKVLQFTDGRGVDAVFDNTGMVNEAIRCVTYGGTIVILGFAARKGVMEEVKMNRLLLKSITLVGYRFGESGRRFPQELEEIWDGYLRMLSEGKLRPLLYGRYDGLESVGRALGDLAQRKVYGKVVVSVTPEPETARL